MASQTPSWRSQKPTIVLFLLCISFSSSFEEAIITSSKKLDYPVFVEPGDGEIKCGSCPCGETCGEQSPPPPPPPLCQPSPTPLPPPSPPPPPPPSPPPPKPSCPQNCNPLPTPPPPPRFIYVPVPGVSQPKPYWIYYYSAAANRGMNWLFLALGGLSMTMVFW